MIIFEVAIPLTRDDLLIVLQIHATVCYRSWQWLMNTAQAVDFTDVNDRQIILSRLDEINHICQIFWMTNSSTKLLT